MDLEGFEGHEAGFLRILRASEVDFEVLGWILNILTVGVWQILKAERFDFEDFGGLEPGLSRILKDLRVLRLDFDGLRWLRV